MDSLVDGILAIERKADDMLDSAYAEAVNLREKAEADARDVIATVWEEVREQREQYLMEQTSHYETTLAQEKEDAENALQRVQSIDPGRIEEMTAFVLEKLIG
jgi:vacuolar-type H+-ATPase subunit H